MLIFSGKPEPASDQELIQRYKQSQDLSHLAELFKRYSHLIYGVCLKYLKDPELSRDETMDIFHTLQPLLLKHEVNNFNSWLYTVTRNHCLMTLRRSQRLNIVAHSPEELENTVSFMENRDSDHPIYMNGDQVNDKLLQEAIQSLKDCQQICLTLFYLEGKSYKEIEHITGFTQKQIKSNIQNGRRNLRLYFERLDIN